ncbi:hypothetical protein ABZS52_18675 [Micromonospora profundi]|uniref:hypothetical protein n=1 Tax=Micromonospora profundi TaxID=1420889 RepID=UPI0033BA0AD2
MDSRIQVDPRALRQFGGAGSSFYLITDDTLASQCDLNDRDCFGKSDVIGVARGSRLGAVLDELPADAAVLVAATGLFIRSTDMKDLRERRISILPCGSTPVRPEHLRYFLDVVARTDPAAQTAFAEKFFSALGETSAVRLVDDQQRTECVFDPHDETYVWNQQAGVLEPGEQQIAPAGELSVLPMDIDTFDPTRRLALEGSVTLRGEPIVHGGYDDALTGAQADLYGKLSALRRHPVVVEIESGVIATCRPGSRAPESERAAAVLNDLFESEPRYRVVWELGFGINTAMNVVPANCGLNEVYGATNGVVHLGVGLTPFTTFALTFICPATRLVGDDDSVLLGTARSAVASANDKPQRRITPNRDASCGCH